MAVTRNGQGRARAIGAWAWGLLSSCLISHAAFAATAPSTPQAAPPVSALKNYYVDPFTGTANFTIPLTLPPLRGRLPFSLKLVSSSRAGNGWLGVGWKLNLAFIERSTKQGFPAYDATDQFLVSLGDSQEELVALGAGEYRLEVAEAAWRFRFDGARWTANDPQGTTYVFGLDDRLNDLSRTKDPTDPRRVFRWRLSRITDPSGNSVILQHLADRVDIFYSEKSEATKESYRKDDYNFLISLLFSTTRTDRLSNARPGFNDAYPFKRPRPGIRGTGYGNRR